MAVHDWFYFFHNVFACDNLTKTYEITLKSSEIMVRCQKLQLSVEKNSELSWNIITVVMSVEYDSTQYLA